jgi:hypothetical protein
LLTLLTLNLRSLVRTAFRHQHKFAVTWTPFGEHDKDVERRVNILVLFEHTAVNCAALQMTQSSQDLSLPELLLSYTCLQS